MPTSREYWSSLSENYLRDLVKSESLPLARHYWFMLSMHSNLSEEFLLEFDSKVNKNLLFLNNLETCKHLSLEYLISNLNYIEDIEVFKTILNPGDFSILKNLHEIRR